MISYSDVREALQRANISKATLLAQEMECILLMIEVHGRSFVLALYEGERSLYAKIVPQEKILNPNCTSILYEPHGLYAFADSLNELISRAIDKGFKLAGR